MHEPRRIIREIKPQAVQFLPDPTFPTKDCHAAHIRAVLRADPRGFPFAVRKP